MRPSCVVNIADLPAEKRPLGTHGAGVSSMVRRPGRATGLAQMGVHIRAFEPGFAGTNRHFHSVEEEWVYILAGRGVVRIGPLRIPFRAGTFVGFPPGPRPHHFIAEGEETVVLIEGGERRTAEDRVWYPDARKMLVGITPVDHYDEPPPEEGDAHQVVHVDDVEVTHFQHDIDPSVRRSMRTLHRQTGLTRQAVRCAQVEAGGRSTVFHTHLHTDEWVLVLSGTGMARMGDDRFEIRPNDFIGYPAGGASHVIEARTPLTYLVGGQIDASDVVLYPEDRLRRVGGALLPL
ncbi:MAG: cupin domain-containing protein [Gammaproteobacteria bacterium]